MEESWASVADAGGERVCSPPLVFPLVPSTSGAQLFSAPAYLPLPQFSFLWHWGKQCCQVLELKRAI